MPRFHPYKRRASANEQSLAQPVQNQETDPAEIFVRPMQSPRGSALAPREASSQSTDAPPVLETLQPRRAANRGQLSTPFYHVFFNAAAPERGMQLTNQQFRYVPCEVLASRSTASSASAAVPQALPASSNDDDGQQELIRLMRELPELPESRSHPLFDHEKTEATKSETVNQEQKYLLEIADNIIEETKRAMPYGSANHVDYKPGALERVTFAYHGAPDPGFSPSYKPRNIALTAATAQAGNCDQMAAFAYTRARRKLSSEYEIQTVSIQGHIFCRIGKAGWPDDQRVIVDPWPKHSYAVLAKDHFSHEQPITIHRSKPGKGTRPEKEKIYKYASLVRRTQEAWRYFIKNPSRGNFTMHNPLYPTRPDRAFKKN